MKTKPQKKDNPMDDIAKLRSAAEQGDVNAQFKLASTYYEDISVDDDYAEAFKWCRKAAEQGHKIAQHNLGVMFETGEGVETNLEEAARWYQLSAEQGYVDA